MATLEFRPGPYSDTGNHYLTRDDEAPARRWTPADTALLLDLVIESLLVRQGEVLTPEVADERARNLVMALLGEYELTRLPPLAGEESNV
jgi:hypothetical protein